MADAVRTLSAELARDPDSLVFLELGELLRYRGQLYLAAKVAVAGLERHADLADAHDMLRRLQTVRIISNAGHTTSCEIRARCSDPVLSFSRGVFQTCRLEDCGVFSRGLFL